jgi:hypothetical protein
MMLGSCTKFLDAKPNKQLVVPQTLQDLQSLADNVSVLNGSDPSVLEISADSYYITSSDFAAGTVNDRNNYLWDGTATYYNNWFNPYKSILYANLILENLPRVNTHTNDSVYNTLKGGALFFRSWYFFSAAQLYALPYTSVNAAKPGIPLRLTAGVDTRSVRATVAETYQRIVADLKEAVSILPINTGYKTRPNKIAAYAALARVYLAMEEYALAGLYADSVIQRYNTLLDYNKVNATAAIPFEALHSEIIFHCMSQGAGILSPSRCKVDSTLVSLYDGDDLRRNIYFQNNNNGTFGFKGSYSGTLYGTFFTGLATDEMYLIRAEAFARNGKAGNAINDLNTLLVNRYKNGTFRSIIVTTADDALQKVLTERKKELLFRGTRWSDLRRLNRDTKFAITLKRIVDNQTYFLLPDDKRYVLLIPQEVIELTGISQNER